MDDQTVLQQQAKALGDPTRHAIFRFIALADEPVSIATVTDQVGVHHNGVRQHLAVLVDVGLVTAQTAKPTGRGRPRLEYRLNPDASSRWGIAGPYQRLSMLLLDALTSGDSPIEVGRRAGAQASPPISGAEESPYEKLVSAIAAGGFQPSMTADAENREVILTHCPFADVAAMAPETVCAIHLGITQGLAESIEGISIEGLEPRDPHTAGCRVLIATP